MINNNNLYEILNVQPNASIKEIKSSFRKLAQIHHPDKNNNSSESQMIFQIIYNAYNTLISSEKRKEYDIYLKTSSVFKNNSKRILKKSITPVKTANKNNTLEYLCNQFNFILWEIEDILNLKKNSYNNIVYSGYTINQWLLKILNFIDKWVLEPAGFVDYFYEARKIKNVKVSDFSEKHFINKSYQPYVNIDDYFYQIRKRMNRFIRNINMQDIMQIIDGYQIKMIDSIIEAQMLSYHYLGSLNLIIKNKLSNIKKFNHSNKCYEDEAKELIDYHK